MLTPHSPFLSLKNSSFLSTFSSGRRIQSLSSSNIRDGARSGSARRTARGLCESDGRQDALQIHGSLPEGGQNEHAVSRGQSLRSDEVLRGICQLVSRKILIGRVPFISLLTLLCHCPHSRKCKELWIAQRRSDRTNGRADAFD